MVNVHGAHGKHDRWWWLAIIVVVLGVATFCLSLQSESFYIGSEQPHAVPPVALLVFGVWSTSVSWFANPLVAFSWCALLGPGLRKVGLGTSALALLLALWFLTTVGDKIMTHEGGGIQQQVVGVGPGYWLWVSSMAITFVGSAMIFGLSAATSTGTSKTDPLGGSAPVDEQS